ncbi:CLAVATA3/ESR (CLE)-related protein 25-like [Zingiber officinale]|uniref:CLAVATA3/ESR (CLE)-related protein 25-like n=1 Tax=Zingiber officinale TaxID=94328 RepID=UPI001C4BBD60|nr:CLAVATA3/ESR (CLE)-related protein 25-like [Zingiber officinale]
MRRDVCSGLAFLFYIALLVSMARARCAGARVVSPVVAPAVPSSTSLSVVTDHKNLDPFSSSKRRVPNGADPIHNRRAGKSGRPPGRA